MLSTGGHGATYGEHIEREMRWRIDGTRIALGTNGRGTDGERDLVHGGCADHYGP